MSNLASISNHDSVKAEYRCKFGAHMIRSATLASSVLPSLQHVVTVAATSSKGLSGSVLNASATKVMIVVPEDGKLKVWDVWGKLREGKKHSSFMGQNTIR